MNVAPLLQHLEESRKFLDEYIAQEYEALDNLKKQSEHDKTNVQKELELLKSQKALLETRKKEVDLDLGEKRQEIEQVMGEVTNLREKIDTEMPQKIGEKAKVVDQELKDLEKQKENVQEKQQGRALRKNELSKGVTYYKERLGLSFERMPDNSLSFRMNMIDAVNPSRPFTFAILVNQSNVYEVVRCEPKVDYEKMLSQLNNSNDFGQFVKQMRTKFQESCK